jgi:hypothetical protein
MLVLGLALSPVVSRGVHAQVLFGSIVGSVTDSSGAAVPGAQIRVTQKETNESREVTTNDAGGYNLSTLPAGTYDIAVSKAGFRTFVAQETRLSLNTVVRVDAVLQVGTQSESVTVSAEAAQLQTDRSDVHGDFSTKQITDLPQPTRTYQGVMALMTGVAPPTASSGETTIQENPCKSRLTAPAAAAPMYASMVSATRIPGCSSIPRTFPRTKLFRP